jgi:hypothetical protein
VLPVYFVRLNRLNLVGNYVEMLYKVAAEHHGDGNITGVATASNQNRPDARFKIPAKTVVKFRVAKAAKDAVLGAKK